MNLRRLVADVRLNVRIWSRYPGQIAMSIAMPCVMFLVLGVVAEASAPAPGVAVLDEDGTAASADLLARLARLPGADVRVLDDAPSGDVAGWMAEEGVAVWMRIPAGFEAGLATDPPTASVALVSAGPHARGVELLVEAAVEKRAAELSGAPAPIVVQKAEEATAVAERGFHDRLLSGMVGLVVLTMGFLGAANNSMAYAGFGVFRKLSTTPLQKREWVASKIVLQSALVLAGATALLLLGLAKFSVHPSISPTLVLVLVFGSVALSALGIAVVSSTPRPEHRGVVLNAVYLPMVFLSGTFMPTSVLPEVLQVVSLALPLTHVISAIDAAFAGASLVEVAPVLLGLVALAAASLVVAVRRTDWTEDS